MLEATAVTGNGVVQPTMAIGTFTDVALNANLGASTSTDNQLTMMVQLQQLFLSIQTASAGSYNNNPDTIDTHRNFLNLFTLQQVQRLILTLQLQNVTTCTTCVDGTNPNLLHTQSLMVMVITV